MPWSETSPMDERMQFVAEAQRAHETMTALCDRYGISRKTGYKWCARYAAEGPAGLFEHSRCPHTSPTATCDAVVTALLALRARHPRWGARSSSSCSRAAGPSCPGSRRAPRPRCSSAMAASRARVTRTRPGIRGGPPRQ